MILNETLTGVFYGYITLQFLGIIEYDKVTQGDMCIKMIQLALGLNCLFGLIGGFYNVFQFFKNLNTRKVVPMTKNLFWETNLTAIEYSHSTNYFETITK